MQSAMAELGNFDAWVESPYTVAAAEAEAEAEAWYSDRAAEHCQRYGCPRCDPDNTQYVASPCVPLGDGTFAEDL